MAYEENILNTFTRLCIALLIGLPVSAIAGEHVSTVVDDVINWGFWCILLGAIAGGTAATFIQTEVDEKLSNDKLAKLVIGSALGFFACLSWVAYSPETSMMTLALPSFVLGCLGAPIVVFLLTWASDARTFNKASKRLNQRLGLDGEDNND